MKIMQLCFSPVINSAGGAEKVFCNMANHFVDQYEVVNICCDNTDGKPFYQLSDRVKFINLAGKNTLLIPSAIKLISELLRVLKHFGIRFTLPKVKYRRKVLAKRLNDIISKENPDVIVCYELDSAMALKLLEVPLDKIVVMYHNKIECFLDLMTDEEKQFLMSVRYNQVLLNSDKKELEKQGFNNVVCIGNIVPKWIYDDVEKEKVILHVGRLDKKQKRQHLAIEAFSKIASKYPEWRLRFIGGNCVPANYKNYLEQLILKYKLEERVELAGISNRVESEISKASFFVLPSAFEGFSLAMTEAMSAGLPVIGFKNTPSVNELIVDEGNGLLCDDNADAFAAAMERLIVDEKLRVELGKKAVKSMKKYSAENIYRQWDDVIQNVGGNNGAE